MSANAQVRMLTPAGIGGIAAVELSGPDAERILEQSFRLRQGYGGQVRARGGSRLAPGEIRYGHVIRSGETLDEVIVARVPADSSEPIFEIHCHGGMIPARRIIAGFVADGATEAGLSAVASSFADPSAEALAKEEASADGSAKAEEGTSFLGRMLRSLERRLADQLINARTTRAADVLLVQLSGRLRAALESARANPAAARELVASWRYGRRLVDPATVVITGAPNVGKSTLANALVGRERSIVHHLSGTTRDAVASVASLDGFPATVVDTAGLREAADEIERIGVEKAVAHAAVCDLVVWVFDHSRDVTADEARYLGALKPMRVVPVINKMDLAGPLTSARVRELTGSEPLVTCALTGRGIDALRQRLVAALVGAELPPRDAAVVTLADVAEALEKHVAAVDKGAPVDYVGSLLV